MWVNKGLGGRGEFENWLTCMRYLFIISRQGVVIWWRKSEVGNIVDTSLNRNNLKERKQDECR